MAANINFHSEEGIVIAVIHWKEMKIEFHDFPKGANYAPEQPGLEPVPSRKVNFNKVVGAQLNALTLDAIDTQAIKCRAASAAMGSYLDHQELDNKKSLGIMLLGVPETEKENVIKLFGMLKDPDKTHIGATGHSVSIGVREKNLTAGHMYHFAKNVEKVAQQGEAVGTVPGGV